MMSQNDQAPKQGQVDVSIIICTYNRAAKLDRTLQSLASMDPSECSYEVIIIDNRSDDNTKETVSNWSDRLPLRYSCETRPGLSHARNTGIAASHGRYIFFTDDDCVVNADWIATGVRLLSEAPLQIIGGRVDLHDPADLPVTIKIEDHPASLTSGVSLFGFLHGCNMIFGRCVVGQVGLFDTSLGAGTPCKAGEDADFVYRAFKKGIPVHYRPELRLAHNHGRKDSVEAAKLADDYNLSIAALAVKHLRRGDALLLKVAYWALRSEAKGRKRIRIVSYFHGGVRYGFTLLRTGGK